MSEAVHTVAQHQKHVPTGHDWLMPKAVDLQQNTVTGVTAAVVTAGDRRQAINPYCFFFLSFLLLSLSLWGFKSFNIHSLI